MSCNIQTNPHSSATSFNSFIHYVKPYFQAWRLVHYSTMSSPSMYSNYQDCNKHPICTSEHVKTLTTAKISKSCLFGTISQVMRSKKCNNWLFTLAIRVLQKSCGAIRTTSSSGASHFRSVAKNRTLPAFYM